MNVLISAMNAWHLEHTSMGLEKLGCLSQFWCSAKAWLLPPQRYKRIWPYHMAMKPFYHLAPDQLSEKMRWLNLPFYDAWIRRQSLPPGVTIVQGAMGSCSPLFDLAERTSPGIIKIFEAMNGHPTEQRGYWQREADLYSPGYRLPVPEFVWARMNREIRRADYILCPSTYVRDTMVRNGVPDRKIILNHFGANTSVFFQRGAPPSQPKFITVGSMTVRKGMQYLFRAFVKLRETLPDAQLYCYGSSRPDFKAEMKRWSSCEGIHFPDDLAHPELAREYSSSTAFVLPSLEEGFARSILEALASGLPIIATHESGATTLVRDGESGLIVPPCDIPALTNAMYRLATDRELCRHMGETAWSLSDRSNSWDDYAARLVELYDSLPQIR